MSVQSFDELREHVGHEIECVIYGESADDPRNAALECVDCFVVLIDFDRYPPDIDAMANTEQFRDEFMRGLVQEVQRPQWKRTP